MDVADLIDKKALWRFDHSPSHVQTLESGLHSDLYLNTDYVVSNVPLLEEIVSTVFVQELQLRNICPDWIVTYPPFGLPIAYALARQIGAKFAYVDIKWNVCNFDIREGDKVIIVGDDIYSGTSLKQTIAIIRAMNAKVEPLLFTIGNFTGTQEILGLEVFSVLSEKGNLYTAEECPMCASGSKPASPRLHWHELVNG